MQPSFIEQLVTALRVLPGVGPRSAMRMAYYLLNQHTNEAKTLANAILDSIEHIGNCSSCNTLCDISANNLCDICKNDKRDNTKLCIVEMPIDIHMLEQTNSYNSYYFVLMGKISPLDGIGPNNIAFEKMLVRASQLQVQEVILATSFTTEGETTAYYIAEILRKKGVNVTRLARGVPAGSELEYVDTNTIARALVDRKVV